MIAAGELAPLVGISAACSGLGVARATFSRRQSLPLQAPKTRGRSPRALSPEERDAVLAVLHGERFVDCEPAQIVATLLDEGSWLCSTRTMYRLLEEHGEVRERRDQVRRPSYAAPELLATGPNQVWSWDITKLRGPTKGTYFHLYVIIDIFSRCVVGWMVARRESAELAKQLIAESCARQGISPGSLTIHADRGSSMKSKPVALLLSDLGVTKSHSRPHVSNDNPYSESHFRTFKYRSDFPDRFGSFEDARAHCQVFFPWYNTEHRHSGIGMLTPEDVHYGRAPRILAARGAVLALAHAAPPERFVRGAPRPAEPPSAVWINPPAPPKAATSELTDQQPAGGREGDNETAELRRGETRLAPAGGPSGRLQ